MKDHIDSKYLRLGLMLFCLFAACAVVLVMLLNLSAVRSAVSSFLSAISPLFYGLIFAYLLNPIMKKIENWSLPRLSRLKLFQNSGRFSAPVAARTLGILLAVVTALLVIYALFSMIIPQLGESLMTITSNLTTYYNNFRQWSTALFDNSPELNALLEDIFDRIYDTFKGWLSNDFLPVFTSLTSGVFSFFGGVLDVVIGLIISVYVLGGKNRFQAQAKKIIYAVFKVERANWLMEVLRYTNRVFGQFIIGKIIDSLIIGILCFICVSIMNMPFPLLISIVVGVTNVIPFFGPFLGAIPCCFFILVVNPIKALYFAIFIFILQQFDGNILGPKILGNATGVSGFWVVVSILIFSAFFGVIGMIIAVPSFAVISMLVNRKLETSLSKKGIDENIDFESLDHIDPSTMEVRLADDVQADNGTDSKFD